MLSFSQSAYTRVVWCANPPSASPSICMQMEGLAVQANSQVTDGILCRSTMKWSGFFRDVVTKWWMQPPCKPANVSAAKKRMHVVRSEKSTI